MAPRFAGANEHGEAAAALAQLPDAGVLVATVGLPDTALPAAEGPRNMHPAHLKSTWDVMSSAPTPGQRVLQFDDHGGE